MTLFMCGTKQGYHDKTKRLKHTLVKVVSLKHSMGPLPLTFLISVCVYYLLNFGVYYQ
jgi:hypothetical protein